jgi:two-component sensor histidine kinase
VENRVEKILTRIMDHYVASFDRNSIEYWLHHMFYLLSFAGIGLGTLCLLTAVFVLLPKGLVLACAVLALLYSINVIVILSRRIPLKAKSWVISTNFYLFGLASLILAGPMGESGIWFTVSVLVCSLFIGFKASLLFAFIDLFTGISFGVLHTRGLIVWTSIWMFPLSSWLLQSANIFFIDTIFAVAISKLIKGVGSTFRSLTAAESKIRSSLTEKETLIRELYHRTKNNMQVVSSLLMLNAGQLQTDEAKDVFKDVLSKIGSMSLVHEKLYESQDLSNIDSADYIRDLVALLMDSYGPAPDQVAVDLRLEDVKMLIDTAVPCGLVISEIVTNSLKYAFPEGRKGRIDIGLKKAEDDSIELRIADDGVGLPDGFQVAKDGKMGMKTLFTMVRHQLHGEIQFDPKGGLAYTIRFKANLYRERVSKDG